MPKSPTTGPPPVAPPSEGTTDGEGPVGERVDSAIRTSTGAAVIGSAEWDLLTDDVRWSAEAYRLLGCDPGHGPLSLDRLPDRLSEADRPQLRRMMTDALVHGRYAFGTLQVRRPDGGHGMIECTGEPVLGTDGTVTALRMLLRPANPS
ncbi:PAS fold-containing protein [Streptomyces sp. TLI_053]|uniref:PAS domain-containing protein n=1 Tax=Streptomyces sp. TLI_053 TaxID=1855352 RepID=UPI00087943FD|nr:PAS domain-containing protein [Streptomyces sp. TLI_053]SDT23683.1 PAS fold-containing protein [Streptomyces sp. TLI_053]